MKEERRIAIHSGAVVLSDNYWFSMSSTREDRSVKAVESSGGRTRVRIGPEPSYLNRLGVVWAYPLRLTIVTELYMREMSVTEFFNEFGGGSLGNVRWHFQKLVEHGWLRKVRSRRGRRGRPQDVYRSTELAFVDAECAEELPLSVRIAFSTRILQQMGERVAYARIAQTVDSRQDRVLFLMSFPVDERGWLEVHQVVEDCFHLLAQEQLDAKVRISSSDEKPTLMMVSIASMELPGGTVGGRLAGASEPPAPVMDLGSAFSLETRLAKVFADPVNVKIVNELDGAAMSPSELAECIGDLPVWQIDKKCKHLEKYGWVARVEERTGGARRGATEVFYRATRPPAEIELWPKSAYARGSEESAMTFHDFYRRVVQSFSAGVLDQRYDRHLTWSVLLVDELGWEQVTSLLRTAEKRLGEVRRRADQRLKPACASGFEVTCFLAGFEIPPSSPRP
jgi:hypothetical protein